MEKDIVKSELVDTIKSSSYCTTRPDYDTAKIDTITLHCLPDYSTVDKIFNYCNSKQISCNYAIDKSGNVVYNIGKSFNDEN